MELMVWMFILYLILVRNRMLKCPHCGNRGISASKKFLLGPIFSLRCSMCDGRWGTSIWSIFLAFVTIPCAGAAIIMSKLRAVPDFIPVPGFMLAPLVLTLDVVIRLYVLPTKRR